MGDHRVEDSGEGSRILRIAEAMATAVRRSKIQVQVLSLYKDCLRAAEKKTPGFKNYIRNEFKRNAVSIARTDTMRIEYLVRSGRRKLDMMNDPNVSGMGQFVE